MKSRGIAAYRLAGQQISHANRTSPEDVVSIMGAMQAQDFHGALWAIGLRCRGATQTSVEQAIADRRIVRTWPMRGTLHIVAAADVRWMLELLTPRVIEDSAARARHLELDDKAFAKCRKLFQRELSGNRQQPREAMMQLLEANGISTANQRGYHILWRLAQEGVICFGAREGTDQTFALLDEWVPTTKTFDRDAALAELAFRYFTSHGPATLADFMWWSGLKAIDARAGLEAVSDRLFREASDGTPHWWAADAPRPVWRKGGVYLLPGFDEYLLGYKNRGAVLDAAYAGKIVPGRNGVFLPTIVVGGRVVGTWKRHVKHESLAVTADWFELPTTASRVAMAREIKHLASFLGIRRVILDP